MKICRMNHDDCLNSVPAVEGFQIIDITEDGFLLTGDFRWCALFIHTLQMVWCEELDLLQKLCFCADQLLDELTRYKWNRGRITKVVQNKMHIALLIKCPNLPEFPLVLGLCNFFSGGLWEVCNLCRQLQHNHSIISEKLEDAQANAHIFLKSIFHH